jgi:hypothetical protein
MALGATVFRVWWVPGFIVVVLGVAWVGQRGLRNRARRLHAEVAPAGGGAWLGRVPVEQAEALWGVRVRRLPAFNYFRDGYPVELVADATGLTMHPRGLLLNRMGRLGPVLIPWGDLAGARACRLGYTTEARESLWLVPLTKVTLDLVGASAAGHLPPPSPQEWRRMLRRAGIDPDALDEEQEDEDDDSPQARAEEEAFGREVYGEDWQPGTEPLHLTTPEPSGLVEIVAMRGRGRPASTPLL